MSLEEREEIAFLAEEAQGALDTLDVRRALELLELITEIVKDDEA